MHKLQVTTIRLEPSQAGPKPSDEPKSQDPNRLEEQSASRDQRARATEAQTELEPS